MAILFMRITCHHLTKLLLDLEVQSQGIAAMSECLPGLPQPKCHLLIMISRVCVVVFGGCILVGIIGQVILPVSPADSLKRCLPGLQLVSLCLDICLCHLKEHVSLPFCRLLFQCRYSGVAVKALVVEVNKVSGPEPVVVQGPLRVELRLASGQCSAKGCVEGKADCL